MKLTNPVIGTSTYKVDDRDKINERYVVDNVENIGLSPYTNAANVVDGAQNGVGVNLPYIDGMQALVANGTFLVMTHYPTFFNLPGYELNKPIAKALIERLPTSVSGIDFGYTVNTSEAPIGHDTQQLSTPTNVIRSGVSPSFTIRELKGNLVNRFFTNWMFHIQHPDTNASIMSALFNDDQIPDWVVSTYSMTMIGLWFDETMLPDRLVEAAVYCAMFPFDAGEMGFGRDLGTAKTIDRQINFKGIVQHNSNTRELGKYIARALQMHKPNFRYALTAKGIELDLRSMGLDGEAQRDLRQYRLQSLSGEYQFDMGDARPQKNTGDLRVNAYNDGKVKGDFLTAASGSGVGTNNLGDYNIS